MDINTMIPLTGSIPIPAIWFEILSVTTFVLHLLAMNALVGGGIIALVNHWQNKGESALLAQSMKKKMPTLLAFTVNLAIAPLLFLQVVYGAFVYTSAVLMAVYLLSIILIVIVAYYALYFYEAKFFTNGSHFILLFSLSLLLIVGFFITNLVTMMHEPQKWLAYFEQPGGTVLALDDIAMYAKFLHMLAGITAVGGLTHVFIWNHRKRKGVQGCDEGIKTGMSWFKYSTAAQVVLGTWYLLAIPRKVMKIFMGGNMVATALFTVSLVLLVVALYAGFKNKPTLAIVSTLIIVVVMAVMRAMMRAAYLEPYFSSSSMEVTCELGSFIMFAVSLLVGMAIMAYMIKTYFDTVKES